LQASPSVAVPRAASPPGRLSLGPSPAPSNRRRVRFRPMPYLSEIQHRRVIESNGNEVGKLADIAVVPQWQFPAAQWAIIATPNGEKVVRWADLAQEIGHF